MSSLRRTFGILALAAAFACGGSSDGSGSTAPTADGGTTTDGGTTAVDGGQTSPQDVVSISLSQTDVHIPEGTTTAFAVTGTRQDGTRVDVTQQANAVSSNTEVATVAHGQGSQILITARDKGTATITVTYGSLSQNCAVTVTSR